MNTRKHAYLIMAHNQWNLLDQLLSALDDPRNDIYLHIDKKVPSNHIPHFTLSNAGLFFVKRYNIVWGGTQMMHCTISMLEQAAKGNYSYYHFISGTDFPIKSQDYIHTFLEEHKDQEFISFNWSGIQRGIFMDRTKYYHFLINIIGKRNNTSLFFRLLAKAEDYSLLVQKKLGVNRINYDFYKGSSWFSITHKLSTDIVRSKKSIFKRYRFGANTDEVWLQTFVKEANAPYHLASSNLRHIKWIQGNPSPETLTTKDWQDLQNSDCLFARKFDYNEDKEIIALIKDQLLKF